MASDRTFLEIVLFAVLLVLLSAQVVVYWACTRHNTEGDIKLSYDQAIVVLGNHYSSPTDHRPDFIFSQVSTNCYKCSYSANLTVPYNTTNFLHFIVSTTFPTRLYVSADNSTLSDCPAITHDFRERSHYSYIVSYNKSFANHTQCTLTRTDKGDNAFLPILYAAVAILTLSVLWVILSFIHRFVREKEYFKYFHFNFLDRLTHRDLGLPTVSDSSTRRYRAASSKEERHPILNSGFSSSNVMVPNQSSVQVVPTNPSSVCLQLAEGSVVKKRLTSLDAFRGMSLTVMIFVNYGGGGYWFFDHSVWNGLTVADLVFPWFIWIMGVSLVFSFRGRRKHSFLRQFYQILRRTIILFAVGLFLNTSQDTPISKLRIAGVLQRFSITYLVVALTELLTVPLYQHINMRYFVWSAIRDVFNNSVQWVVVVVLESLWLLLTFLLPVPGCPRGYLGPGGISDYAEHVNCTGGAAGYIDRWILGNDHLYDSATAKDLYQLDYVNYDPEGVLGSLNSIVLCFLGVQAGKTLLHFRGRHVSIIVRFIVWGLMLSSLGAVLCLGQKNDGLIPLNKNLWSLSFILVMGGTGYLVLAFFYLVIDAVQLWNGSPFKYPGMNSIIVYVGHDLLGSFFPFAVYQQEHSHMTFLAANLIAVSIWLLISYYWTTLNFFVKI